MEHDNRVVWSEGMFLRVQHFQQQDRWTEKLVKSVVRELVKFPWGISRITINEQLLGNGMFALSSARGVMPDGSVFEAPGPVDLPPALRLEEGTKNVFVYLCLPMQQPGLAEIGGETAAGRSVRYARQKYEVQDTNEGSSISALLDVGRLRLSFLLSDEELAGYDRIAVARIVEVRQDQSVVLDENFIAPSINCAAQLQLENIVTELLGIMSHRAEAIADRMGDPSIRGTAEVSDFQFLQVLNRNEAVFRHHRENLSSLHPETLYVLCAQLAGELSTFTKERRRGSVFPGYRHLDLRGSFDPVLFDLRESLSSVLERSAIEIPLDERKHGVRVGTITDRSLLAGSGFVLAVRCDMPSEALRSTLPRQIKVGPVERIAELVNVALPGIAVRPLPVAPRQLPYRPGTSYFELDRDGALWKQLSTSGAIAMHLAGDFPAIEFELWAIKS
ncbi:type VI secretion system baseplate subunit TssK [Phyllobacterium myrsinacearum]|uniref:Type VI secretion system protein ImpJ n=1 Tax=Phyllobacterium myrsinacearum TaxID=28101 RepID=A0A839ELJ1_9HYPH|nr:type VI secretion system baseplate subunit TssK [Phyllobacterium myrsinacearum]MBA8879732.1 type VI secretion system protein ImpJ [Phyllobacterium myrsinacearum]